jgi:5'(3')-deoxyribonucleotidase
LIVKSFELENSYQKRPIVYVDMDGTIADMFGEIARREGASHWRKARKVKDKVDQVAQEPGFFAELKPMPNAGKLLHGIVKLVGKFSILSSPLMSEVERSSEEKTEWITRYLRRFPIQSMIFDHQKEKYARQADGTPNILIDDWETNIRLWEANGGIGILYKDEEVDKALKKLHYALEGLLPVEDGPDDDSDIDSSIEPKLYTSRQVLKYVKGIHNEYHLEKPILSHKTWQLREIPIEDLKSPEFYDQDDPYRRVIDLDWEHIDHITKEAILKKPIVADENGWVLDGNHRVTAARMLGLKSIRGLVPQV